MLTFSVCGVFLLLYWFSRNCRVCSLSIFLSFGFHLTYFLALYLLFIVQFSRIGAFRSLADSLHIISPSPFFVNTFFEKIFHFFSLLFLPFFVYFYLSKCICFNYCPIPRLFFFVQIFFIYFPFICFFDHTLLFLLIDKVYYIVYNIFEYDY